MYLWRNIASACVSFVLKNKKLHPQEQNPLRKFGYIVQVREDWIQGWLLILLLASFPVRTYFTHFVFCFLI